MLALFASPLSLEGCERLQPLMLSARVAGLLASRFIRSSSSRSSSSDLVSFVGDYSGGAVLLTGNTGFSVPKTKSKKTAFYAIRGLFNCFYSIAGAAAGVNVRERRCRSDDRPE